MTNERVYRLSEADRFILDSIANWFENRPLIDAEAGGPELTKGYAMGLRAILAGRLPDEPPAEHQGVTFGCSKCSDTVTLQFTDATKRSIDIRPMNGWVAGPGGCFCPRCAQNRPAPHE